jgi:hypothetical protein
VDVFSNFLASLLGRLTSVVAQSNTLALLLILATVAVVMMLLVLYLLAVRNYLTNTRDFFRRRIDEMKRDQMVGERDVMMVPVVHGKKTVIPLEPGELLHFYLKCQYWFFPLTTQVRNVNIDLVFSDAQSLKDFENIGRGRLFFTSRMLIFENVRSRNKVAWAEITEIKVKFGHLILFDRGGCHAFAIENPELVSDFIYHVFLKDH